MSRTKVRAVQMSMFPDIRPDKPFGPILPSVFVGSNADLIDAIAPYYLTGSVCDVTFGEGAWWKRHKPADFVAHDLHKLDGVDFTDLPEPDDTYDTVCFDPPYVVSGGESSANLSDNFQDRYGVGASRFGIGKGQPIGRERRFETMLRCGLNESIRVSRRLVLVKCMEFTQGSFAHNDFHDIPFLMTKWAMRAGCVKHDIIVHHTGSGPGGHNIFVPKRARRHHSYLIVFRKGKP